MKEDRNRGKKNDNEWKETETVERRRKNRVNRVQGEQKEWEKFQYKSWICVIEEEM